MEEVPRGVSLVMVDILESLKKESDAQLAFYEF